VCSDRCQQSRPAAGHSSYPLDNTLVLTENPDAVADSSSKVMHHGWAMRELIAESRA